MSTDLLLILLATTAGYLLIAGLPHTLYRRPRRWDHQILFASFVVGVLLLLPALALHEWLSREFSSLPQFSSLGRYVRDVTSIDGGDYARPLSVALISFILALLIPKVYEWLPANWRGNMDKRIWEAAKARESLVRATLMEAMESDKGGVRSGVEILLENDMVCAGIVIAIGVTLAEKNSDIELMLMHRGYRDRNTGKFVMVETYAGSKPEDYPTIMISAGRIASVRKFRLG